MNQIAEPQTLFPLIAAFLVLAIWGTTFGLIRIKHTAAEHAAAVSSRELLGTYEAQVVRVLREIDQTLNLVKFWHERSEIHGALSELKDQGLLPPALIFTWRTEHHKLLLFFRSKTTTWHIKEGCKC